MAIQIHDKKYNRQLLGVERWRLAKDYGSSHTNCWGTWWWQTGTGKTFAAIIVIKKILNKNPACNFYIMVPGPDLKIQWEGEIKSNIEKIYWSNIEVLTVGQIESYLLQGKRLVCSLFIADELHEYYTEEKLKIFDGTNIITKWMLGLTADYEDRDGRYKKIQNILPVVDRIDEEEASREGYISKYIEYNLAVDLTEKELATYKVLSSIISKYLAKFGHRGLELAGKILVGDKDNKGIVYAIKYANEHGWRQGMVYNSTNAAIIEQWAPNKIIGYAKLVMDNVRERKNLLYYSLNKLISAKNVVNKFNSLKTICFSQSTLFADALGKIINESNEDQQNPICVVYHSQLETLITYDEKGKQKKKGKTILKREAIEAIRSGKARVISTASSLDKGFDVKDIRLALTTSGTQNPTQYNQRKGRVVRVESYEEDIIDLVINLYIRNTMDEVWLKKRQSKSKTIVYWVDSIDDINYSPRHKSTNNLIEI